MALIRTSTRKRTTADRGQTLVEFAVVFPLFWTLLVAVIEFAFGFQSVLAVSYASRNAAVIASEAGRAVMADCAVLRSIETDLTAPSSAAQIQKVDISWTDSNGVLKPGATTTYTRSTLSTIACSVNGSAFTLPYSLTADGYPMSSRCSTRSGCAGHVGVDTVSVKLTYRYVFHTPYGAVLGGTGWTLERSSDMRMEPYQ